MMALLSPRFWLGLALVAALTFTHYFVYKSGKSVVRLDWDKERDAQMADALKASETFRVKEIALNASNLKVANDYIAHKKLSAAAAVVSADKLRDLQSIIDSTASTSAGAISGSDDPRDTIINQCGHALVGLDDYAKDVATKASALQEYAKLMRLNK